MTLSIIQALPSLYGSLLLSYFHIQCIEEDFQYLADYRYYELQYRVNADGIPCYKFNNSTFDQGFNVTPALQMQIFNRAGGVQY